MAVEVRKERQSHRFHSMKLLGHDGGGHGGDINLNVVPLVDMMMVLVIFLVMNFNASGEMLFLSKDMKMALSEHGEAVTRVPIIAVSYSDPNVCDEIEDPKQRDGCEAGDGSRNLYFEGQLIESLNDLDMSDPNWRIAKLEEKLIDNRQRFEAVGGDRAEALAPSEDPTTTVNIQVHKKTDFQILKRVLYTCEQAGYGRIRLTTGDGRKSAPAEHGEGGGEEE